MSKIRDFLMGRGIVSRRGITEVMGVLQKATKTRKAVTEAKSPVQQATVTSAREYIQSGDGGGGSSSSWPIPRFAREAATFTAQVLGLAPKVPPPPPVPGHLCPVEEVTEFLREESTKRGFLWAPPGNTIVDWCNVHSPFNRPGLCLIRLWDPYRVCIEKAALVQLVEEKAHQQRPAQQQGPSRPVWRPSLAEQAETRAADAAARRTPAEIVAEETAAYLAQREQAEAPVVE